MIDLGTGIAILGMAFGAWAWVIAWGVGSFRRELQHFKDTVEAAVRDLKIKLDDVIENHIEHRNTTEHRVTRLESDMQNLRRRRTDRAADA